MAQHEQPDWQRFVMEAGKTGGLPAAPTSIVTAPTPLAGAPRISPSFDVIEQLPEERKDLFRKVCQHADDAHAIIPEFEQVRELSMRKIDAANSLKRLTDHPQDFGRGLPETDPLAVAAQKHLDKMTADFERLNQLQEVRSAAWQSASQAKAACEDWLRHGVPGNCQIEAIEIEPPKLLKGEGIIDTIERLRRRCRELKADAHRISSSPFPSSYCKQRMRAQVEALAMQGAPNVSALIEIDGKVEFQTQRLQSEVHAERRLLAFAQVPDTLALTCWLHKDALIAALDREISTESDDPNSLSHEAREMAEAEVMSDLLLTERDICSLIWRGQADGLPVEFPADISPLAILQVQLITVPRTTEMPGTSPGLSWPG
jgi:hypothetical protein